MLIGIDLFLATSVIATLLEDYYPKLFPYLLDIGSLIGFMQLWSGPTFLNAFSDIEQFYYCAGFALTSVMVLAGSNLYLFLVTKRRFLCGAFAVTGTVPACLILLFFVSAYVNSIPLELPITPVLSWTIIYLLISASAATLFAIMFIEAYKKKKAAKVAIQQKTEKITSIQEEEQISVLLLPMLEEEQTNR